MDKKDYSNLGEQIKDSVQDAIDSMDFKQLNKTITETVGCALDEAKSQMLKGIDAAGGVVDSHRAKEGADSARTDESESKKYGNHRDAMRRGTGQDDGPGYRAFQMGKRADADSSALRMNHIGRISGILCIVFGAIGLGVDAILLLTTGFLALLAKPLWGAIVGVCVFLVGLGIIFGMMVGTGIGTRQRLKRAELYLKQVGSRLYCNIEELARGIGKTGKFVAKDLQKMIEKKILPEAHMDEQKTCLMLDEETYQQYLSAQNALKQRQQERLPAGKELKGSGASASQAKAMEEAGELPEGLKEMMDQGRESLKILREANDAIPGETISKKIARLENVIRRIFETLERKPEAKEEMGRFMDYYLPTTVKLVTAYRDFDKVEIEGSHIGAAKSEIEKTLDTINTAFERLLDDLYQDAAFDISTDASVLQTMLKKDGFAGSDFDREENHG